MYSQKDKALRNGWFDNWLENNQKFSQEEILKFHQDSEIGTPENSLKMKRWYVETVSITSVKKTNKIIAFNYEKVF